MAKKYCLPTLSMAFLLNACVSTPSGPSYMALPGAEKTFSQFRKDDYQCRKFADEQVNRSSPEKFSERVNQQRYDMSYVHCMYEKDHRVPVHKQFSDYLNKSNNFNLNKNIPLPPPGKPPPPPEK